jgi:hypothetical protein
MKITIWVYSEDIEMLNKFLSGNGELDDDFQFFSKEPGTNEAIMITIPLEYYIRLKDY